MVYFDTDIRVEGLEFDDDGASLLKNEELLIIPMSKADDFINDYVVLGGIRPQPNLLLVLSPYDDETYMEIADARNMVAVEKAALTIRLCKLLGAKRVEVVNIKITDTESTKTFELSGKGGPISSGKGSVKIADLEYLRNQIKLEASFEGGEPSVELAEGLMKGSRLISDPLLKNMLDMVKDDRASKNRTKNVSMNVSLTHSLQTTLDVVAKLKFPAGSSINMSVGTVTKKKVEIYIEVRISFVDEAEVHVPD